MKFSEEVTKLLWRTSLTCAECWNYDWNCFTFSDTPKKRVRAGRYLWKLTLSIERAVDIGTNFGHDARYKKGLI
jgi:hypothetical protein